MLHNQMICEIRYRKRKKGKRRGEEKGERRGEKKGKEGERKRGNEKVIHHISDSFHFPSFIFFDFFLLHRTQGKKGEFCEKVSKLGLVTSYNRCKTASVIREIYSHLPRTLSSSSTR